MESREQRKESWHRLLHLFSFMALSIARFESTGTAGSQKANPTSSFFVYQRCPANLLLATFDRAGLIDLYPASCWRNIRSLFGVQAAVGAVCHALMYTRTYNEDTDIQESIFFTSCEPELISEEPYWVCIWTCSATLFDELFPVPRTGRHAVEWFQGILV